MFFTQPSTRFVLSKPIPRVCIRPSPKRIPRMLSRRQYANGVDGAAQAAKASSKLPWILSLGALTAGGAYSLLQPTNPKTASQDQHDAPNSQSTINTSRPHQGGKRDWYASDHPKPVEDRHGDSVKKHSIAAEKNEYKVRTGVFSDKKFDNHVQKREGSPAEEFEMVEDGKGGEKEKREKK